MAEESIRVRTFGLGGTVKTRIAGLVLVGAVWTVGCRLIPTHLETIQAPDPMERAFLGSSVAVGDALSAIGSRNYPDSSGTNGFGRGYVFRLDQNWDQEAEFMPEPGRRGDGYGAATAVTSDSVVIGAPASWPGGDNVGVVYSYDYVEVVLRLATGTYRSRTWMLSGQHSPPEVLGPTPRYGSAVAADGDQAIVGASVAWDPDAVASNMNQGAVVFYQRNAPAAENTPPTWSESLVKTYYQLNNNAEVGRVVAMRGDIAVAGAPGYGQDFEGAVYVFQRIGGEWRETQMLTAPDPEPQSVFGSAVSTDGHSIVVGAAFAAKPPDHPQTGAIYLYGRTAQVNETGGNIWSHVRTFYPDYDEPLNAFGRVLAIDGSRIVTFEQDVPVILHRHYGRWYKNTFSLPGPVEPLPGQRSRIALRWPHLFVGSPLSDVEGLSDAGVLYYATDWRRRR